MSNEIIFKIIIGLTFGLISLFTAIGAIKEGKESLEKLREHEELKMKKSTAQNQS